MFLSDEDLHLLTGYRRKSRQITQLKKMGLPFFVNASGHPVVTESATEGRKSQMEVYQWEPKWAANRV